MPPPSRPGGGGGSAVHSILTCRRTLSITEATTEIGKFMRRRQARSKKVINVRGALAEGAVHSRGSRLSALAALPRPTGLLRCRRQSPDAAMGSGPGARDSWTDRSTSGRTGGREAWSRWPTTVAVPLRPLSRRAPVFSPSGARMTPPPQPRPHLSCPGTAPPRLHAHWRPPAQLRPSPALPLVGYHRAAASNSAPPRCPPSEKPCLLPGLPQESRRAWNALEGAALWDPCRMRYSARKAHPELFLPVYTIPFPSPCLAENLAN